MAAFVPGASVVGAVGAAASSFVAPSANAPRAAPRAGVASGAAGARARILDGLDTGSQQPYSFSRYILGPFQGKVLPPSGTSDEDRETVIRTTYRHVFGNAYIMEEERAELAVAESQFKLGAITMREFVRAMGQSSAYKTRFFEGASMYRFVELNFMHFLGRAPDSHEEVAEHMNIYHSQGVDAEIDSYLNSAEYLTVFGEDTAPFLRFRGAYTPCESFSKQCALKGGWANSDKAMGGAALSGYNGSDGRQMSTMITAHVLKDATTPFESIAENTPLKTTAPNWYACPDPALAPTPAFVSENEVLVAEQEVATLEKLYAEAVEKKRASMDSLSSFRSMTKDMGPMLDRGLAFSAGDPLLINPFARAMDSTDSSPLTDGGCKSSDYMRYGAQMENDTVSRLERDLEAAKADLRNLKGALESLTPLSPQIQFPSEKIAQVVVQDSSSMRPKIKVGARKTTSAAAAAAAAAASKSGGGDIKLGPISVSVPSAPSLPSLPSLPNLPNPFAKK